jgi:uncharacterized protein (TIGR03437 family)
MLDLARLPGAHCRLVGTLVLLSLLAAPLAATNPGWTQQQILTASDGMISAEFGASITVDGNTAVIGAPSQNGWGAAYVYVQNGGAWDFQQELTASDRTANAYFGYSISVSGDTVVIGAFGSGAGDRGSAYVFVRSGTVWTQQQELTTADGLPGDRFGYSVSVDQDTAVIGARLKTFGANGEQGAAYVFRRNGTVWTQQQELMASDGAAVDCLGTSVSLSGNAVAIGASCKTVAGNPGQGAAYVFTLSAGVWSQQQELTAAASGGFGDSVSLCAGTLLVGGANNSGSGPGAAWVFTLSGGIWSQQQQLTPSDGGSADWFGSSVSLSGSNALIGAYGHGSSQGVAYVFVQSGGVWAQKQELVASDPAVGSAFGISVCVDGEIAMIGALHGGPGAAYVLMGSDWLTQTIAFGALVDNALGTAPFTISATASSGLTLSFSSLTNPVCTVAGSLVTLVTVGACSIQATQAGNNTFLAAPPVIQGFQVTPEVQTITFAALAGQTLGAAPFTVSATASSALAVNFSSLTGAICSVAGSTVALLAGGTCTVEATQAGNATYLAAPPVDQSFQVAPQSQTITFGALANQTLGAAAFTVAATASSALAVSFSSLTSPVCSVAGSLVTLVAVGTCTIQATQAGNSNYVAATPVSQGFQVTSAAHIAQTITFWALSSQMLGAAPFGIGAAASSGLPVSFVSLSSYVCTVSNTVVFLLAAGTCTIQATQAGNATYAAAAPVDQGFQVTQPPMPQAIAFAVALADQPLGTPPFTVSAAASSGLPVSFVSLSNSVCTLSHALVTLVAVGTCTIRATQVGNGAYAAAVPVSQSFQVTPESQSIAFAALATQTLGAPPFTVGALASSGLPVGFSSLSASVCTVAGSLATLVAAGTCTVQATQAGNFTYAAATPVSQSFTVNPAVPLPTITGIIGAGAFGAFASVAPGTWVEIYGSNLAANTVAWTGADFTGNIAPTSIGGVQVAVGGQPAFIDFVSPGQVNVQLPSNLGPGAWQLTLSSGSLAGTPANITVNATEPGLLAPPSFLAGGNQYVVAQLPDGTYVLPAGAIAGVSSRPAKPGETIVIYGIGFGAVVPNTPAGQIAPASSQLVGSLKILFGQTAAQVKYAGLAPGLLGLYQFNVVVPPVADNAVEPLAFTLGGVPGSQTLYTAVHK